MMWAMSLLSMLRGPAFKYAAVAVAVLALLWYVHHKGATGERAKWEAAVAREQARQVTVNQTWVRKSAEDADTIDQLMADLERLQQENRNEAATDDGADTQCLSELGVMRLNRIK